MRADILTCRRKQVGQLQPFCYCIAETLFRGGTRLEEIDDLFRTSLFAECIKCGVRLAGEDLLLLTRATAGADEDPKIARLRAGRCVGEECDCRYYSISFQFNPRFDWITFLARLDAAQKRATIPERWGLSVRSLRGAVWGKNGRRIAAGVVFLLLLILWRQWYLGGRIPLIREPEHFRVGIADEPPGR